MLDDKKVELVAMCLSMLGQILITFKNEFGFIVWFFSNLCWISIGLKDKRYFFTATFIFYSIFNIISFLVWYWNWV